MVKFLSDDYHKAGAKKEFLHEKLKELTLGTDYRAFDAVHILTDFIESAEGTVMIGINDDAR